MRAREGRGVVESGVAVVLVNHFQIHHYQPHPPLTRFLHSHPHTSSATLRRVCMSEGSGGTSVVSEGASHGGPFRVRVTYKYIKLNHQIK